MKPFYLLLFNLAAIVAFSQTSWNQKNDFPLGLYFLTSFTINDTAYAGLGADDAMGLTYSDAIYRYNSLLDIWEPLGDFPGGGRYAPTSLTHHSWGQFCQI